jgi:SPX domain protein involved in polyphosphate accumulation
MRDEIKYLIPTKLLPRIREQMLPYLRLDQFAGSSDVPDYCVRSIYYDTRDLRFYHEKKDGIKKRIKVRIRGYNEHTQDSIVFLELKRKRNDQVFKNRYPIYYKNINDILSGKILRDDAPLKKKSVDREKFLFNYFSLLLRPTLLVIYEREAYYYKFNPDLRITFDKNIRSVKPDNIYSLFTDEHTIPTFRSHFVLEIKFSAPLPSWVFSIIKQFHLQKRSVSKYVLSVDKQFEIGLAKKRITNRHSINYFI